MASAVEALIAMPSQSGLNSSAPGTYLAQDELSVAENITYGLNAERKKRPGFTRYNGTSIGAFNVNALADFWRYDGVTLNPQQLFVATAGGQIWSSVGNGEWGSEASFGSDGSLTTNILIAGGFAVFSDGVNTPKKFDMTDVTDLGTSTGPFAGGAPPNFTAGSYHLSRIFAVGIPDNPSGFQVSAGGDVTVWSGTDTLTTTLDKDDGDAIVGISRPFHKRVYMFKGPNYGSIHEIAGNTLGTLERDKVFEGLPLHNHKALITTPNDIFWLSHFGIHSLVTTQNYGDTQTAFLSFPIQDLFTSELNQARIGNAIGFWNPLRGIVGWWVTSAGSSENDWALVYHYLISDPAPRGKKFWSIWKLGGGIKVKSSAVMLTPRTATLQAALPRLYVGGAGDGLVFAGDQTSLTDDGSAYTARVKTGINLHVGSKGPMQEMQFYSVSTFFNPVGNYDHQLNVTVDNRTQAFTVRMQGAGDVLG